MVMGIQLSRFVFFFGGVLQNLVAEIALRMLLSFLLLSSSLLFLSTLCLFPVSESAKMDVPKGNVLLTSRYNL